MIDPKKTAKSAGLKYVTDKNSGIRRKKSGKGFYYVDEALSEKIKSVKILARIKSLVIPPAWTNVWICRDPLGHLQATGLDKRKRKQYRYHPNWHEERTQTKFFRLREIGEALPVLRKQIEEDLKLPALPQKKVLAAVIKIMIMTQTRVGNALYAEENDSYGLTTLLNKHAEVSGSKVKMSFKGKSGIDHDIAIMDKTLSKIISRCQELPGQELFCYQDDNGKAVDVNSSHVNDYLREVTGKDFTAKDLRTWGGTTRALEIMIKLGPCEVKGQAYWKRRHSSIVKETAEYLRNTVSVCRKYYIHPILFNADQDGVLHLMWKSCRQTSISSREERLLLMLLQEVEALAA